jgi:hypothetical protein
MQYLMRLLCYVNQGTSQTAWWSTESFSTRYFTVWCKQILYKKFHHKMHKTEQLDLEVTLWTCTQLISNLGQVLSILTRAFCSFPQCLQANAKIPWLLYDHFLPNPFQFIIHQLSYYPALYSFDIDHTVKPSTNKIICMKFLQKTLSLWEQVFLDNMTYLNCKTLDPFHFSDEKYSTHVNSFSWSD